MSDTERPLRFCDVCGGLDDHPRHVQAVPAGTPGAEPSQELLESLPDGAPATAIALLLQPTTTIRHLDCCAAQGCEICAATEAVTAGARGQELIETIASGVLDGLFDDNNEEQV